MSPIERLRFEVVSEMMTLETIDKAWSIWKPAIHAYMNPANPITANDLMQVGNHLYDVFKSTSTGERSQGEVSAGGTGWEVLVCWYLNLCLLGSNTVVIKAKKKHVPTPISNSITVMYGSTPSGTESDLLAITFPNTPELRAPFSGSVSSLKRLLDREITDNFSYTSLTVIQCKTNWNDNAQVPMLWDLIYSSTGFKGAASVGTNGFVNSALKDFRYAFVTVPTTNPDKIKSSSTCVMRVRSLSGGNYWGRPSVSGVAMNLFDMLNKNFNESLGNYSGGWNASIPTLIASQLHSDDYFRLS